MSKLKSMQRKGQPLTQTVLKNIGSMYVKGKRPLLPDKDQLKMDQKSKSII